MDTDDANMEPKTVAKITQAVRRTNQSARSNLSAFTS